MGLKCSLLGHSFEPADVERERKEEGSEVVTVTREIERCLRCDEERVVSESTEVTAVVDEDEVGLDDAGRGTGAGGVGEAGGGAGASGGVGSGAGEEFAARDPEEEDTEILTDEEPEREPGAWPEEPDETWDPENVDDPEADAGDASGASGAAAAEGGDAGDHAGEIIDSDDTVEPAGGADDSVQAADGTDDIVEAGPGADDTVPAGGDDAADRGDGPVQPDEETLSGITVPEGTIVCTECSFSVDAESSYRDGDPCPDCGAWLTSERNR